MANLAYKDFGGNTFNTAAGGYYLSSVATVAATGSTQGDAAALTAEINKITASDATKGVVLPTAVAGMKIIVVNTVAAILKVYGATGAAINGGSANAALSQAASTAAMYVAYDSTNWYTVPKTPS